MPGRNVFTVLETTAAQYGDAKALHQPLGAKSGGYRSYSWNEWVTVSREIAAGLRDLGLQKGDVVCVLSETRAEFYLVDLGIMGAGGVSGALYTAYPMPDLARDIVKAQPRFLFVEDPKALAGISKALDEKGLQLPEHTILITGSKSGVLSLDELGQRGRAALAREPGFFGRIQEEISPDDPAILYLTSGATGEPKMGVTSHSAVLANLDMAPVVLPTTPEDSMLVFLPSAHIAQRIVLELVPMRMGTPVWFSESLARLPNELRSVRPTIFLAPPRVWERMYATIQTELRKRPAAVRKLFYGALGLGLEAAKLTQTGKPIPAWMSRLLKIANKLFFSKVRDRLGGRIRIAASGAAPLARELGDFYAAIGMPLIEGYGLTEAGVICFNPLARPKPGSIGTLLPGVEARLAEDGELQVWTPCIFKGYYKDEAATRSVLSDDGWFSTGDIAELDSDGYWYITGRKKELIVSSNGKKIYPARIESFFKTEPLINQVVLVGDKKPYVTALVTINAAQMDSVKGLEEMSSKPLGEIVGSEPVTKAVQEVVSRVNRNLADFERIRRFKILERDFSIEAGELTPTMKIRRGRVLEKYASLVTELYLGREEMN
ncbi:MAG: long-chain fatty acid--CoA ligase [Acidobacteriaceae bacterium]|nr:long-chain fatty acid--CoA ligase [Acidobacteriaceae bacterium]